MKPREQIIVELVRLWVRKAEEDLAVARLVLESGQALRDAAGFHSQQAAEKYLKAFLTSHQIEFSKSHDIGLLLDAVSRVDRNLADGLAEVRRLTPLAVQFRYPGEDPPLSKLEAEECLQLAETCRTRVRSALHALSLE